ncbi:MAG: DNA topoisomerase III [Deltaproteobacteria bacterium]|nr:DNA topoisomerase III [Deltaproteobacteria bacterium]
MRVFICEKPSQAREIAHVLGAAQKRQGYLSGKSDIVTWCLGHLFEQVDPDGYDVKWKRWDLGTLPIIPERWKVSVTARGKTQFHVIKGLLQNHSHVVIATDADREGETIAREVLEYCSFSGRVDRLWLSALDERSIKKALGEIREGKTTLPLYFSGLARSRADWLVGMNLTRLYTLKSGAKGVLSVGRVQTPTLKLVVDRDREIANFKPYPYWELSAVFIAAAGQFTGQWVPEEGEGQEGAQALKICDAEGRCISREHAALVRDKVTGQEGLITKAETKRKKEAPPLVYALSTLQQECNRRFGYGAGQVLSIAQELYETHKATTYPRTDCNYLPESQYAEAAQVLEAMAKSDPSVKNLVDKADLKLKSKVWDTKKITAHHGIIPTATPCNIQKMSGPEFKVYDLIRRRYLAQFYKPFEYDETLIDVRVADELFRAKGRIERVKGWRGVVGGEKGRDKDADDQQPLPAVTKGETVRVDHVDTHEKKTKPPAHFTEGTLIAAMKNIAKYVEDERYKKILKENAGIGTEATRAGIIDTILKRKFIEKSVDKKHVVSTETGRRLIDSLPKNITNPLMTAVWEQQLEDIAGGKMDVAPFLKKQALWIEKLVTCARGYQEQPQTVTHGEYLCPACKRPLVRRKSQYGFFWGCSAYPKCRQVVKDKQGVPLGIDVRS